MRSAFWFALVCSVFVPSCSPRATAQDPVTTVYIVRHAEKLDPGNPDTPLSPEGEARALDLARTLARAGVQRVYATSKLRTQQTVAPLAQQRRLEPVILDPDALDELVARILSDDRGSVVLVAGHSHTVPAIVQGLSGQVVDGIPEERFDRLFKVVIAPDGSTTVEELRYGAPTP